MNPLTTLADLVRRVFRYRSSITGRWVTKDYADAHPDTTQREKP